LSNSAESVTTAGVFSCGSLSPNSSVADLMAKRDAAVDKFSVSISSFQLDVKMGSLESPLHDAGLTDRLRQGVL